MILAKMTGRTPKSSLGAAKVRRYCVSPVVPADLTKV
jgi:hypothetical protein